MRGIRFSIFAVMAVLLAIGVIMIYSSSAVYAYERMGDSFLFLKRHATFLAIGALAMFVSMAVDYRHLKRYSRYIMAACLLLLFMVLLPFIGSEVGGARRWFRVWNFSFQPSEMAKLGLIVYLADFLSRKGHNINDLGKVLIPLLAASGGVMVLILLQPDLGTVIVIGVCVLILLFFAGMRPRYMLGMAAASAPVLFLLICKVPYRLRRIKIFLDPWQDPKGTGFQIIQSFLALGSGGLFGVGLGMSRQKLFYLPEAHTDFIFSIIGEELGLIGTLSVIILFAALVWQGMRVVFKTEDSFGRYLALGIVSMIAIEVIINIGVTLGSLPTKGLPLPFISYGGTALVFHMIAVGLLLNIAYNKRGRLPAP